MYCAHTSLVISGGVNIWTKQNNTAPKCQREFGRCVFYTLGSTFPWFQRPKWWVCGLKPSAIADT